jgi:2-dehydropantoate 2-reductase
MRIAILGAGAMGSLFGARLFASGQGVVLLDIAREHIDVVNRDGLRLTDDAGERLIALRAGVAADFSEPFDLIVVFTKTPHTVAALQSVKHLIGDTTVALTLQNGLGNGARLAQFVSPDRVAIGVTNWPADMRAPGQVVSHGTGEVLLWSLDGGAHEWIGTLTDTLTAAGLNCTADNAVEVRVWEKVAFNAAMNSVTAVTGLTVGEIADNTHGRSLAAAVIDEVCAVARARGTAVDTARVAGAVDFAFSNHRQHKPSMLQDLLAGRATEIEAINGAVVEAARAFDIDVRTVETLARLVRVIETNNRKI